MKTAATKVILYDDRCPLCTAYTKVFVRCGLLRPENRKGFSEIGSEAFVQQIDFNRAANEIPLADRDGGPTLYGIDALLCLLEQRIPRLTAIARLAPVHYLLRKLYALISYNRRIIVGDLASAGKRGRAAISCDCTPAFSFKYRMLFILIAAVFATWITFLFGEALAGAGEKALLVCGSGWVVMLLFALLTGGQLRMDYLGHLAVLQVIGVLPLLPAIWLQFAGPFTVTAAAMGGVAVSAAIMLREHYRRIGIFRNPNRRHLLWMGTMGATALAWLIHFGHAINN